MAQLTFLQLTNLVLRRLRINSVSSVTETTKSTLVSDFVNEGKRYAEEQWNWNGLRTTVQIDTVTGTFRYALTGVGNRYKVMVEPAGSAEYDVWEDTEDQRLFKAPTSAWMSRQLRNNTQTNSRPIYWDINGENTAGDPLVDFWPIPDLSTYQIKMNLIQFQNDLVLDADTLTIPHWPVVLFATAFALDERGDESGTELPFSLSRAQRSLDEAVAMDAAKNREELEFYIL